MTETTELERELRAALAEAHSNAPEPPGLADRLLAAATSGPSTLPDSRVRTSRRWLVPLAAAAAALALVLGTDAIVTSQRDDDDSRPAAPSSGPTTPPATPPGTPLTTPLIAPDSLLDVRELGFHVAPVRGIVTSDSWGIGYDGQWTTVNLGYSGGPEAGVKVYYQGRSPDPSNGTSEDVTVNGLPGTYTVLHRSGLYTARLIWQYAPDSWAEVGISSDGAPPPDTRQQYVTVAEAVQSGGTTLLLPVRFGAVPASLPSIAKADRIDLFRGDEGWRVYLFIDHVLVSATSAVAPDECLGDYGGVDDEFTYRGHRGCVVPNGGPAKKRVGLHLDDADVTYDFGPSPQLPLEDIKRLLADVTVSGSRYDTTPWFDLKSALGG